MVVSKKCKICTSLDADNIAISGEYFGMSLPFLVEKISGIKLDTRKANGVLICKMCATQLVHADLFIEKIKTTLQRLTKLDKKTIPNSPLTVFSANTNLSETKLKPRNSVVRRKSVFVENSKDEPDGNVEEYGNLITPLTFVSNKNTVQPKIQVKPTANTLNNNIGNKLNGGNESDFKTTGLKKIVDCEVTSENSNFKINSNNLFKEVEQEAKTPKKVVGRKSVIPDESGTGYNDLQQNSEGKIVSTTKFIKFADNKPTSVNPTPAKPNKRKDTLEDDSFKGRSENLNKFDICAPSAPSKRYRSISASVFEDSSICTEKGQKEMFTSYNESSVPVVTMKILNCVICGKGFNQKASLREHIESSHMGEKLKQCPNCSTEFRSQQKYESHVFSERCKNSKHACQYPKCNRRFKTVHKMELHMQEKHSSSQQESEVE